LGFSLSSAARFAGVFHVRRLNRCAGAISWWKTIIFRKCPPERSHECHVIWFDNADGRAHRRAITGRDPSPRRRWLRDGREARTPVCSGRELCGHSTNNCSLQTHLPHGRYRQ
jgi:hypothetical protein